MFKEESPMDPHKDVYRQEAHEILVELEEALLALEETPEDAELIDRVFRALHTIKGSGAMFGFDDIAAFTHEVETAFDLIREGKMFVSRELINLSLSSKDYILELLDADVEGEGSDQEKAQELIAAIQELLPREDPAGDTDDTACVPGSGQRPDPVPSEMATYRIQFRPGRDILKTGANPVLLLDELAGLGETSITALTDGVPPLDELDPESCHISWDIILTTNQGENAIRDVFIFVEDECRIDIREIDALTDSETDIEDEYKKLGEILVDRGDVSSETLTEVLAGQQRIGERLVAAKAVATGAVESAAAEQAHVRKIRKERKKTMAASSIRVDAARIDALVDLVGEMVTVQARLSQKAGGQDDPDLVLIAEEVERLVTELRDSTMGIRMLPIGTTFGVFNRLVRDLNNELGKDVSLVMEGSETELDKTVIDQLKDPLVHILRNSIDHGIEAPDVRTDAGKPPRGRVHLSATHAGANVLITVSDDGAGLDPDAIFQRAVEKGLVDGDARLSEPEIFNLIFTPGFSTAREVTGVSGRGVGMDVVKRSIETLRGSIEVESRPGKGTKITLKLPLTLAIIDGLMVKVGDGFFILPLSAVEECVGCTREEVHRARERRIMNIRGEVAPYLRLHEIFDMENDVADSEQVVVVEAGGERIGFGVDQVVGHHQTVIKSLGRIYHGVKGTSGATILGDGTVALVLDVSELAKIGGALGQYRAAGNGHFG
jgi:two-component system chemotaxis sensor kinase CheA